MEFRTKKTGAIIMTLAVGLFAGALANADDDYREGREGSRHSRSSAAAKTPESALYKQECSSCHHLYQPWLLPARSWQAVIDDSDKHFGDNLALDDATRKELLDYLKANSSEKTSTKWAQKITSSSEGMTPKRIMDVPWIKKEHREVSPNVFKRPAVGSASNCVACHTKGAEGNYDEDFIKIPK